MAEVSRDRAYYSKSGGGVTLSGGEPLAQPYFATQLLAEFKRHDLHTAIETSGFATWEVFEEVLVFVDLILFDVKVFDPVLHEAYCGVDNKLILGNLRRVSDTGKTIRVRIPLIPGISDTHSHLTRVGRVLKEIGIRRAELVPYHSFSKDKCEALGKEYLLGHVKPHSREQTLEAKTLMSSLGICT
jgi:pyruvate formate lyase activating enzyme